MDLALEGRHADTSHFILPTLGGVSGDLKGQPFPLLTSGLNFCLQLLVARSTQEKEVGTQLKRQLETAQDHLNDVLAAKETDLNRRVARKLDERDSAEREAYETKLAKMLSQLKALELVLGGKLDKIF